MLMKLVRATSLFVPNEYETEKSGCERIIVSEIPFMVNKAELVKKIADLAREKIDGITGVRDEPTRLVCGSQLISVGCKCERCFNNLFKQINAANWMNIAIVDGAPHYLTLKQMLQYYLDHQEDVVTAELIRIS